MLSLRSIRLLPASVGMLAGIIETGSERWRCCTLADASQAQHDKSLFYYYYEENLIALTINNL